MRTTSLAIALAGIALTLPLSALAEPSFARQYKSQYGYTPSCNACHKDGGGTPVNTYGQQYKDAGSNAGAFARIAGLDADGDGFLNGDEAQAKANPGSKRSTPDDPGDWLDLSNLIPKAVQAEFPGVTTYKPLDAIFTDKEIARARAMGVTLTEADETTIYIPVADRKPAGTAIIVPGVYENQQFFVLLTTDRQLNVTSARALEEGRADAAEDPALYAGFAGTAIADLPAGSGDGSVQDAVTRTVKKAGTMLLVRLKK